MAAKSELQTASHMLPAMQLYRRVWQLCWPRHSAAGPVAHHVSPVANIVPAGPSSTAEWHQMQLRLHVVAFSGRGQGMSCCQGPPVATAVAQPSAVPEPGSGPCGSDSAVKKRRGSRMCTSDVIAALALGK